MTTKFKPTYGKTLTLFIDGADLLAMQDKNLFIYILAQAKVLANKRILTIVFVNSKGSVVPLIQASSLGAIDFLK